MDYLGTDRWLEPRDEPETEERDVVWEFEITLIQDKDGEWLAQSHSGDGDWQGSPEEAVKSLFAKMKSKQEARRGASIREVGD